MSLPWTCIHSACNILYHKVFFQSLCFSTFLLSCTFWRTANEELINNIQQLQKHAARLITDIHFDEPSAKLFEKHKWLVFSATIPY